MLNGSNGLLGVAQRRVGTIRVDARFETVELGGQVIALRRRGRRQDDAACEIGQCAGTLLDRAVMATSP